MEIILARRICQVISETSPSLALQLIANSRSVIHSDRQRQIRADSYFSSLVLFFFIPFVLEYFCLFDTVVILLLVTYFLFYHPLADVCLKKKKHFTPSSFFVFHYVVSFIFTVYFFLFLFILVNSVK